MITKAYLVRYSCHKSRIEKCTEDSRLSAVCGDHGGWLQTVTNVSTDSEGNFNWAEERGIPNS